MTPKVSGTSILFVDNWITVCRNSPTGKYWMSQYHLCNRSGPAVIKIAPITPTTAAVCSGALLFTGRALGGDKRMRRLGQPSGRERLDHSTPFQGRTGAPVLRMDPSQLNQYVQLNREGHLIAEQLKSIELDPTASV